METPQRSKQATRAYYDRLSRVYDLLAESSEGPIKEAAARKLEVCSGERILEIGCGTGHILVSLGLAAGPTGHVYGLDLSTGMLAAARARLARIDTGPRVELICADALHLPLPSASLDAVFTSFTLELFDDCEIPLVLAECRRVLRLGGRIAVAAVSTEGPHGVAYGIYEWTHRHFPTLVDCHPIALAARMEAAGFVVQARTVTDMWVPVEIVLAA